MDPRSGLALAGVGPEPLEGPVLRPRHVAAILDVVPHLYSDGLYGYGLCSYGLYRYARYS